MIPPEAKKVFEGVLFDVYQWEQELFDGTTTTFEKLSRNDSAVVIPILADGSFLLELDEQPSCPSVITFPAGKSEDNEAIEETARRELLEETGYAAKELILWKVKQPSSKIDWSVHFFIARGCEKVREQELDGGERITLIPTSFDELLAYADDPRFQNGEIVLELIKACYDESARKELETILYGA